MAGTAFIPPVPAALQGVWRVNQALLGFIGAHRPGSAATLDMDATLIGTHKRDALHCHEGFKAYQPLNCWWAEQGTMLYSEFRDGNVPAGHQRLRALKDALSYLPANVKKLSLRSDTAGYQEELLLYCGEGKDKRFGVIEFAIGADAAWWALMILAHNLNAAMKQLVLGKDWVTKRMKALRFALIGLPGRVVRHACRLLIRLGADAATLGLILAARETIRALACGPGG